MMHRISLIVATKDRPDDLQRVAGKLALTKQLDQPRLWLSTPAANPLGR